MSSLRNGWYNADLFYEPPESPGGSIDDNLFLLLVNVIPKLFSNIIEEITYAQNTTRCYRSWSYNPYELLYENAVN